MLGPQIDNFLQMMSAEKGAAPSSVAAYERDLRQFIEFGPFIENDSLTKSGIEDFMQDLHSRGFAPKTIAGTRKEICT